MRYRAIRADVGCIPVLCRVAYRRCFPRAAMPGSPGLKVPARQGIDGWPLRFESSCESRRTFGSPRASGVGKHRIAPLMCTSTIRAEMITKWEVSTDSANTQPVVPNTFNRQFAVAEHHLSMAWGHHVHLGQQGVALSGGCARLTRIRLLFWDWELLDAESDHGCAHHGSRTPTTGPRHSTPCRPWGLVYLHQVPRIARRSWPDGE